MLKWKSQGVKQPRTHCDIASDIQVHACILERKASLLHGICAFAAADDFWVNKNVLFALAPLPFWVVHHEAHIDSNLRSSKTYTYIPVEAQQM